MSIDAAVPIMVLRLISAKCCLIPVDVENDGVDSLQVAFKPFLESFIFTIVINLMKALRHQLYIQ
jgi:hypothetical protein